MRVFPTPREEIFSGMVKMLFYAFKTIGLAPFSIQFKTLTTNSRNTSIKVFLYSRMGLFYNLVLATVIQIIGVRGTSSATSLEYMDKSSLNQALDLMQYILPVFTSSFISVYFAFRQKKAAIIMNRLIDVHFLLHGAREQLFNKRMRIFLSLQMAFHIVLWAISLLANILVHSNSSLIMSYSVRVINYFLLIEYSIILGVIIRELEILNRKLLDLNDFSLHLFRTTIPHEHLAAMSSSTHSQLATLKLLHSIRTTIFDLSQDIADYFSFPILLCIACAFLSLVEASYFIVMLTFYLISYVPPMIFISCTTWILISIIPLMLLAYNVTETTKQASLTGRIVHTLLATSKKQEIIAELEQFSRQLLHEDVRFTAYGFFILDFTLLQSIFGATVTYLVIVIQFVQPADNHH